MKLSDLLSAASLDIIETRQQNILFSKGKRMFPKRERLHKTTVLGREILFSPPHMKQVFGEAGWVLEPQLPNWLVQLKTAEKTGHMSLRLFRKSGKMEMAIAASRVMAIGHHCYQAPAATSNTVPYGKVAIVGGRQWFNEDWATDHSIDTDGDRAYGEILEAHQDGKTTPYVILRKFPIHKAVEPCEIVSKTPDRFVDFNEADWKEVAHQNPPLQYTKEVKMAKFVAAHTPANVGIITNNLNLYDLISTQGMSWVDKLRDDDGNTVFPSLIDDERYTSIEGGMKAQRNGGVEFKLRSVSSKLTGTMCLLSSKAASTGKVDVSKLFKEGWKDELYRVYTFNVNPEDFVPKKKPWIAIPPTKHELLDGNLIERLMGAGVLHLRKIGNQYGTDLGSYIIWMTNGNGKPCVFIDRKRNPDDQNDWLSYTAILLPVYDAEEEKWYDGFEYLKECFKTYRYSKFNFEGEEIFFTSSKAEFSTVMGGGFFFRGIQDLKAGWKVEEFRKKLANFVAKYGCVINFSKWDTTEKTQEPLPEAYTLNRIKSMVMIDHGTNWQDVGYCMYHASKAYKGVKFAYYATKAKDTQVRMYPLESLKHPGIPAFGEEGGELKRAFGGRQFLMASKTFDVTVAIVRSSTTKQQTFVTPEGVTITPEFRNNSRVFDSKEDYTHWCECCGVEPSEEDVKTFQTLGGELRQVWVGNPKNSIEIPKYLSASGYKAFPAGIHSITSLSGEVIHQVVPIEELVKKGLHHSWMREAKPDIITINGDTVECFICKVKLVRSMTPSENIPDGLTFMWCRGFWERSQVESARLKLHMMHGGQKEDFKPTKMGSTHYMESIQQTMAWAEDLILSGAIKDNVAKTAVSDETSYYMV